MSEYGESLVVAVLIVEMGEGQDSMDAARDALEKAVSRTEEILTYYIRCAETVID